jgi:putative AdoMet-dependent methyltransferase
MKINEFSKATGLSPRAIRLYEEKGLLKSQREPENRYRIYSQKQISFFEKLRQ